jgi:hypothetical protein
MIAPHKHFTTPNPMPHIILDDGPDPEEAAIVYPLINTLPPSTPLSTLEPRVRDWINLYAFAGWRGIKFQVEEIEEQTGERFDRGDNRWAESIEAIVQWEKSLIERGLL